MPFAQQEQIMQHLLAKLPNLRGAALDARGNGQSLAEAMRDAFGAEVVEAVMLSETGTAPIPLRSKPPSKTAHSTAYREMKTSSPIYVRSN